MYKIMIIEDDPKLQQLIEKHLKKYSYQAIVSTDYSQIKEDFLQHNPDLVLMDINLPSFDGFYWCRQIRTISNVPIIFISARSSDMDQVMAIENGGDDYIVKPFSYEVLIAKVKGVLRRTYGEYATNKSSDLFEVDGLYLYPNQNIIEWNQEKVELSQKEFTLLYCLCKHINQIVSREQLLEALWDDIDFVDDNTLSVNVARVRKKLEALGITDVIQTKRGQGYILIKNWGDPQ